MYDISVCLSAIRKDNWVRLYNSIVESIGDYTFELILCGPHKEPPDELKDLDNVSCIYDLGAPTRAQQISMKNASGRYVTWAADDGWFVPEIHPCPTCGFREGGSQQRTISLAECISELDAEPAEKKCVVAEYLEGGVNSIGHPMCFINRHAPVRSHLYPDDFLIFNCVIIPTQYFKDLGGFDCRFEACPMAFIDLGARAQLDGIKTIYKGVIFECTHSPGEQGDHGPVHHAQIDHDQPLYESIWNPDRDLRPDRRDQYPEKWVAANAASAARIKIDFDNWKQAPEVWERRFSDASKEENK